MRVENSWFLDFLRADPVNPAPALSREDFIARFMPKYARPYEAPRGIRLNARGRCIQSTRGSHQAQVTKRENRISEAYARYLSDYAATFKTT